MWSGASKTGLGCSGIRIYAVKTTEIMVRRRGWLRIGSGMAALPGLGERENMKSECKCRNCEHMMWCYRYNAPKCGSPTRCDGQSQFKAMESTPEDRQRDMIEDGIAKMRVSLAQRLVEQNQEALKNQVTPWDLFGAAYAVNDPEGNDVVELAEYAAKFADAMMAERAKRFGGRR
jgi:hypothetical protein